MGFQHYTNRPKQAADDLSRGAKLGGLSIRGRKDRRQVCLEVLGILAAIVIIASLVGALIFAPSNEGPDTLRYYSEAEVNR